LTLGRGVGAELVGDQSPGWAALLVQETLQQAIRASDGKTDSRGSGLGGSVIPF
jgi:hypothetical protein